MSLIYRVLILAINLYYVFGQQNPTINYISKPRVVSLGDTVDLQCSVQYAGTYPIIWVKIDRANPSNNLFISSGSMQHVPGNRFSVRHDEASSTYTLQITKVQETDAGLYQCQVVISEVSKLVADVRVHIRIPPAILDNSTRVIITGVGKDVTLECYATGFPVPRLSWRRQNNDLLPTGGTVYHGNILTIHNIVQGDRGTYYCLADNGVANGAQRSVSVEVEFAPEVTVSRPRYGQALGSYMDLECHVEAFPVPSIVWIKDSYEVVTQEDSYSINVNSVGDDIHHSTLRVMNILPQHYGNYLCRAANKLGQDQETVELFKTDTVNCPPDCGLGGTTILCSSATLLVVLLAKLFLF